MKVEKIKDLEQFITDIVRKCDAEFDVGRKETIEIRSMCDNLSKKAVAIDSKTFEYHRLIDELNVRTAQLKESLSEIRTMQPNKREFFDEPSKKTWNRIVTDNRDFGNLPEYKGASENGKMFVSR